MTDSIEQEGNRPARTIYRITDAGRDAFLELLRDTWQTVERPHYTQDLALFFLEALPIKEVITLAVQVTDFAEALTPHAVLVYCPDRAR